MTDAVAPPPPRRSISRTLIGAANRRRTEARVSVEEILSELGDRSFAWAMLVFALANMIPAPPGSTLLVALPLLFVTAQMALGAHHLRLPRFVRRRTVAREALKRSVVRLRPFLRPVERVLKARRAWMFTRRNERLIGVALFAVAVALYIPIPLSGGFPAFALVVSALALLERDGLVMVLALGLGAASIAVTVAVIAALVSGVELLL